MHTPPFCTHNYAYILIFYKYFILILQEEVRKSTTHYSRIWCRIWRHRWRTACRGGAMPAQWDCTALHTRRQHSKHSQQCGHRGWTVKKQIMQNVDQRLINTFHIVTVHWSRSNQLAKQTNPLLRSTPIVIQMLHGDLYYDQFHYNDYLRHSYLRGPYA